MFVTVICEQDMDCQIFKERFNFDQHLFCSIEIGQTSGTCAGDGKYSFSNIIIRIGQTSLNLIHKIVATNKFLN